MTPRSLICAALALARLCNLVTPADAADQDRLVGSDRSRIVRTASAPPPAVAAGGCTVYAPAGGRGDAARPIAVRYGSDRLARQTVHRTGLVMLGERWSDRISALACDDAGNIHCHAGLYDGPGNGDGDAITWADQALPDVRRAHLRDRGLRQHHGLSLPPLG